MMRPVVTLLSALPHSAVDVENARLTPHRDYVRSVLKAYRPPHNEGWLLNRDALEVDAERLFSQCREHRVTFVKDAGRPHLTEATSRSHVVIVLAHWKGPAVERIPHDVLVPPTGLQDRLRECVERRIVAADCLNVDLAAVHDRIAREYLADWLNGAIERWKEWVPFDMLDGAQDGAILMSSAYGRNWARAVIDEVFGDSNLLPGARLELADGLWRPSDISACFPKDWQGVCDFVCCTSEYLAEEVKCGHPYATFRADSRTLYPSNVIPALLEMIPRLDVEVAGIEELVRMYMEIAYECDGKYGEP